MSLLTNYTNANSTEAYFLRANAQLINVSTLNAGSISTASITTSSLVGQYLSTIEVDAEFINNSTINTFHVDLDGQILTATPTELLLNGIPVATQSSLSSIADWSLDPAISTVQMDGFDLNGAGLVSSGTVRAGNGIFNNLVAFNSLFVSSNTSTISSVINSADLGIFSTLNAGEISTGAISCLSIFAPLGEISSLSANSILTSSLGADSISTVSLAASTGTISSLTTDTLVASSISTGNISANTIFVSSLQGDSLVFSTIVVSSISSGSIISGEDWSLYPAKGAVNMAGNSLLSTSAVSNNGGPLNLTAGDGDLTLTADTHIFQVAEFVSTSADNGADILNKAKISMDAVNGLQGEINLSARPGFAGIGGVVNLLAEGGVTPLGVSYGGEINLTATTGTFTSLALTSAVNLNAAGINSYAGATSPIGSLAGGNFVHGDSIVNITAGIPPIFSDPLCVYLRGTNGILMDSETYVQGPIRPYSDLVQNPVDLYIEDYDNLITHGYIQLRGVSTQTFKGGDTAILGVNRIQFSTVGGALENVSSLNGNPITLYENVSSFADLSVSSLAVSSINGLNISSLENISSFSEITTSTLTASTISTDTLFGSTISAVGVLADTLLVSTISANTGAKILFDPSGAIFIDSAQGGSSLYLVPIDVVVIEGANTGLITSSITGVQSLTAEAASISSISTATILGANSNLFGLGIQGLEIQTSSTGQVWISSPQTNVAGLLNTSTVGANRFQGKEGEISSLTVSTLYLSSLVAGSFISLSTQGQAAADTPFAIAYTDTGFSIGGISFSTTAIVIPTTAVYEINHSVQLDKSGGGVSPCDFWLRNNGVDIPNSASQIVVQGTAGEVLATVSLILPLAANDKVEVVMASSDATMEATFFQSTVTTPYTRPAIPSLITNVKSLNY